MTRAKVACDKQEPYTVRREECQFLFVLMESSSVIDDALTSN
jgi:hypothetical protein